MDNGQMGTIRLGPKPIPLAAFSISVLVLVLVRRNGCRFALCYSVLLSPRATHAAQFSCCGVFTLSFRSSLNAQLKT